MSPLRVAGVLLLLGHLLAGVSHVAAANVIRGAIPDQIERYQPVDGKFKCFDGSKTIDFNQVNDNFCDCPDSSDEPGTSACPNGVFYCRNRGHEPKLLSTSFVDDGVCDCCDGTDELSGCKNTCIEKNSAKRDALRAKIDEYKASLEKKAQYTASAAGVRENIKQRFQNVDGDIARAEQELAKLTVDKKRIEEETEVKRAEHKKKQEELAAQRKAEAEAAAAKAAEEKAAADKAAADAAAAAQEAAAAGEAAAAPAEGAASGDQAAAGEKEETDEERGRRIAAQWTNDPAAAGRPASSDSQASQDAAASQQQDADVIAKPADGSWWSKAKEKVQKLVTTKGSSEGDAAQEGGSEAGADDGEPGVEGDEGDFPPEGEEGEEPPLPYEEEGSQEDTWDAPAPAAHNTDYERFDDSELRQVQRDFTAAEKKLADLRTEKERVTRQVNVTFNDAWAGLMNKCLEARMPQFTYKFCFFDKATQVDNNGGHETRLGYWSGFENAGREALFAGGDYCHKAPARSLRVKIECGNEERAWDASEPEVCTYVVHASTPAACKKDKLKELEDSMAALLAEEASLAAEIAAEEAQRQKDLAALREKIEGGHDEL